MPFPRLQKTLKNISRRNVLFITFLALALLGLYTAMVYIPQTAREKLQTMLADVGFKRAYITDLSVGPGGIIARNIKLDSYGLDEIKMIDARVNWISFLGRNQLSSLKIEGVLVSLNADTLSLTAQRLFENLLNLPYYKIDIENATIDIATQYGNIRMTAEAHVNNFTDGDTRDIKARIKSAQYQLGFETDWRGVLKKNGQLELSSNIIDGRLNIGPLRISRFNGWLGLDVAKGSYSLQGQIGAGSATFLDIPLQSLSVVQEYKPGKATVVARAGVSGIPDVVFSADYTQQEEKNNLSIILKGDDLGGLLTHAESFKDKKDTVPLPLAALKEFSAQADYQPELRFAAGPLPFALNVTADDENLLKGNILIYPENFDVRGSVESDTSVTNSLKTYFGIAPDKITGDFIRIDANAKDAFKEKTVGQQD